MGQGKQNDESAVEQAKDEKISVGRHVSRQAKNKKLYVLTGAAGLHPRPVQVDHGQRGSHRGQANDV